MILHNMIGLLEAAADGRGPREALVDRGCRLTYDELGASLRRAMAGLRKIGLRSGDRVAVLLDKRVETVLAIFAAAGAGGIAVPINPLLKPDQVAYVLGHSGARFLVTASTRLQSLGSRINELADLHACLLIDEAPPDQTCQAAVLSWQGLMEQVGGDDAVASTLDSDPAAILYTSGSTGRPKGVVLSHRNIIHGAFSVAAYLENRPDDRILCLLPLSFDAGFSQVTTAFRAGATAVLFNYLLPQEVVQTCARERITGMTCVPPLWMELAKVEWPSDATRHVRYLASTGGAMPRALLEGLRKIFSGARPFVMYGLTEAFRSTYLDPAEVDRRPGSIGKAVPDARLFVTRPDGSICAPGEAGELVHTGAFVTLGYWKDEEATALRFRPPPSTIDGVLLTQPAVWSGDMVRTDEDGFLYFVGRSDDMIKTSGYRVSPTEVEEVVLASGCVAEAVAAGVPHPERGQVVSIAVMPRDGQEVRVHELLDYCQTRLPSYMIPTRVVSVDVLPRSPNGKFDRPSITRFLRDKCLSEGAR